MRTWARRTVVSSRTGTAGRPLQLGAGETELAGDQQALDLARPLPDLQDLRVAVEPGDGGLLHEAVAAVDLDGLAGAGHRDFGRVQLRDGRLRLVRPALLLQPRRLVHV